MGIKGAIANTKEKGATRNATPIIYEISGYCTDAPSVEHAGHAPFGRIIA
jgi:hypothetical protein